MSNERDRDFSPEKILRACKHFSDRVKKYKKDWKVHIIDFFLNCDVPVEFLARTVEISVQYLVHYVERVNS